MVRLQESRNLLWKHVFSPPVKGAEDQSMFSNTDPMEGTSPCWEVKLLVLLGTDNWNCALSLLHCHPHSDLCCCLEEGLSAFICVGFFCIPDRKIHFYTG